MDVLAQETYHKTRDILAHEACHKSHLFTHLMSLLLIPIKLCNNMQIHLNSKSAYHLWYEALIPISCC